MNNQSGKSVFVIILAIIMYFTSGSIYAEGKKRIAVLNFAATNAPENLALGVRELTEVSLYQTELFDVLERSQIKQILTEQDLQETRCEDASCGVKIGKLLSADIIIIGSVVKLDTYTLTIKYVGVKNGKVVLADSETADSEGDIKNKVNLLIDRSAKKADEIIANDQTALKPVIAKRKAIPGLYYMLGFVPGGAQVYSGHSGKATLFFSTFIISAIGTGLAYDNYKEKRDAYNRSDHYSNIQDFNNVYNDYKTASNIAIYTAGLCGLIYVLNWFDVIFISKPDFEKQFSGINFYDNNVSLNIYSKQENNLLKNINISIGNKFK